jgi:hypothetical protein
VYFVEAEQETTFTTRQQMLARNYEIKIAKEQVPTTEEHQAYLKQCDTELIDAGL